MKRFTPLLIALAAGVASPPAEAEGVAVLTVTIEGVAPKRGVVRLGLFDEAGYDGGGAVAGAAIEVDGGAVEAVFEDLAPGTYGIRLYHDVDADGEMDANPFGVPTEPFAFSNNARGRFGPPSWEKAAFEVPAGASAHAIEMNQ